jgi:hypothetical protein
MAKRSRPTDPPADGARKARKRVKRLERELTDLRVTEARRREQLDAVRARVAEVHARLTTQWAIVAEATGTGPNAASGGPIGFCMREKRPVRIDDPKPVTLSNGRAAIAGTCSICGARVMVLSTRSAATLG